MAKFLKSVETLMAQVLISVYGEVLLVTPEYVAKMREISSGGADYVG